MTEAMWIVLVMCSAGTDLCRDVPAGKTESGLSCLIDALPKAAEWLDKHPGFELLTVRCQSEEPVEGQDL